VFAAIPLPPLIVIPGAKFATDATVTIFDPLTADAPLIAYVLLVVATSVNCNVVPFTTELIFVPRGKNGLDTSIPATNPAVLVTVTREEPLVVTNPLGTTAPPYKYTVPPAAPAESATTEIFPVICE
jgi:hypothetical protein